MDQTGRLSLPFLLPGQGQKHITHNEALQTLDALVQPVVESRIVAAPPGTPLEGEAWLVPANATGTWAGHGGEIAAWQANAWHFLDPAPGWTLYCLADSALLVFDGVGWTPLASAGAGLTHLGINTDADSTNRLAVAGAATLLTHEGAGHQLKLNKAASAHTASLLFQSDWSGRAEMGLMGDDEWRIKISPDGTNWIQALTVAPNGIARFGGSVRPATDNSATLGAAGARWSVLWSATGTIQTSDARQKTDIAPCDLGLDFILALHPVRYRWRVGGHEDGAPLAGRRIHYGLLAQQVQETLQALGSGDFGGHVLADSADPDSEQGLRYDAFIAPLIAAIQQLAGRIEALEGITHA